MSDAVDPERPSPRLVVIDGPAGAGKTTIARQLARRLGLPLLDTGAIYRAVALLARERDVAWDDEPGLVAVAQGLPIRFGGLPADGEPDAPQTVWLGDRDISTEIRTPDISQGASIVSAVPGVRKALLALQRAAGAGGCVAEGRDMGTVVFPDAPHKFFVTAALSVRASRRRLDLGSTGPAPSVAEVEADLQSRDARDSGRATAPLARAKDAVVIDTSALPQQGVLDLILGRLAAAPGSG